ncbi:Leucine Rich Repeat [Seminavis robusta]|uniref:Leucine Rich Repeat n=1 Tax=Seminavis robusta TaxID=568900 RepID=A0A9N8DG30_9STRA|nr:Leucine Rich Repeat [Seminavis robusta]|eukprot:Sro127_g060940.1 Leucine Rich Repeat (624) ;mRNA; f:87818-89689
MASSAANNDKLSKKQQAYYDPVLALLIDDEESENEDRNDGFADEGDNIDVPSPPADADGSTTAVQDHVDKEDKELAVAKMECSLGSKKDTPGAEGTAMSATTAGNKQADAAAIAKIRAITEAQDDAFARKCRQIPGNNANPNPTTNNQSTNNTYVSIMPGAIAVDGINASAARRRERDQDITQDSTTLTAQESQEEGRSSELRAALNPRPSARISASAALHASLVYSNEYYNNEEDGIPDLEDLEEALDVVRMSHPNGRKNGNDSVTTNRWLLLGLTILVFAAIMAVVLGLILGNNSTDTTPTETQTRAPTANDISAQAIIVYPPYDETLPVATLKAIQDPSSPLYHGNAWMMNDPNLDSYPLWRKHQRFSMVTQYYGAAGDDWFRKDDWLSYDVSECAWYTSKNPNNPWTCDEEGHFVTLDLHSNNLEGILPPGLLFEWLEYIDMSNNQLHGTLPAMFDFSPVQVLMVHNNSFRGPLIGNLNHVPETLRILRLDGNQLESQFLGYMSAVAPNIEVLNISSNRFGGSMAQWKSISNLRYLGLADNDYVGALPTELGLVTTLQEIDLSGNAQVTGSVPSELGQLDRLQMLDISGTALTGAIPKALCFDFLTIRANCSLLQCCQR